MLSGRREAVEIIKSRILSAVRPRAVDSKVLAFSLAVLAALCVYRFYSYWATGFFVSDEFGYYFDAIHATIYSDRWFVGWVNILLFRALGVASVDAYSYLLPFYLFFWTAVAFIAFYKLLKLLGFNENSIALSLLSSFILISFVLLSLGFLTEPVGLSMAMSGTYFLARFLKSKSASGIIAFAFLACCFFGFAAGTREPYDAFLIAGGLIILAIAVSRRKESIRIGQFGTGAVLVISVLAFLLPAAFFLTIPSHAYSQQVAPISGSLLKTVGSNPLTSPQVTWTTITNTVVTNTVTINGTVTVRTTITNTTIASTSSVPFFRQFVLSNTLLIFFGGLLLGWGPICFGIGLLGFLILFRKAIRRSEPTARFALFVSLTALGSYLVVSFLYAPDPYYFSLQNYSTLIRFSDTALPAYFLLAPFFLLVVSKSRKRVLGLAAVFVAFLLIAVPIYQGYASSNFNYTTQNPFQLGYRSDAVLLRNYFAANVSNQAVILLGVPYGWTFTPGVQDLYSVQPYAIGHNPIMTEITYGNFTMMKWPVFYLYVNQPSSAFPLENRFLVQFFNSTAKSSPSSPQPFTIVGTQPVLHGSDFTLYKVTLVWQ